MDYQIAYQPGPGLIEMRIPAGLRPDAKGHYEWTQVGPCRRCGGQGGSNAWPGWTCYECGGARLMPYGHRAVTLERAQKLQRNAEKRAAKAEVRYRERLAAADSVLLPRLELTTLQMLGLAEWLNHDVAGDILRKMLWGATKNAKVGIAPSDAQWQVLVNMVARAEAIAINVEPPKVTLAPGRQTLTGTFVMVREQRNDFGSTTKGLFVVEASGGECKVWMTAPKEAYVWDPIENEPRPTKARLELAVTIDPAQDPGFHYGTRPAKVRALEATA